MKLMAVRKRQNETYDNMSNCPFLEFTEEGMIPLYHALAGIRPSCEISQHGTSPTTLYLRTNPGYTDPLYFQFNYRTEATMHCGISQADAWRLRMMIVKTLQAAVHWASPELIQQELRHKLGYISTEQPKLSPVTRKRLSAIGREESIDELAITRTGLYLGDIRASELISLYNKNCKEPIMEAFNGHIDTA